VEQVALELTQALRLSMILTPRLRLRGYGCATNPDTRADHR
jgi:hypothetical protein